MALDATQATIDVVNEVARDVYSYAYQYVPVDTGNLQSNLEVSEATTADMTALVGPSVNVEYAEIVNDRTHYLERAADAAFADLEEKLNVSR